MILLPLVTLLGAFSGLFLLCRFPRLQPRSSDIERQSLSIVIPVRNEEDNLPRLLQSLQRQAVPAHEIIVADDSSTDNSAAIAHSYNAKVVSVTGKTEQWTGKTFALQSGAKAASGDLLFFLDADTEAEPRLIEKLTSTNMPAKTVRSIQPYHKTIRLYEGLSLLFNTLIFMGIGAFTALGDRVKPSGSFGPALLIRRDDYLSLGGHESVKGAVLEHFTMGSLFEKERYIQELYSGRNILSFRMYPNGVGELLEGWMKGFFSGASGSKPLFLALSVFWITSLLLLPLSILLEEGLLWWMLIGLTLLISFLQFFIIRRHVGSFPWWNLLFLPLHALFFITIFTISAIKIKLFKKVRWRGREIQL